MPAFRRKGALLIRATTPPQCQVRSRTESPCPRRAAVEIRGVAFCGLCAREQEAYFAIGELVAQEEAPGPRSTPLVEALGRVRRESAGAKEGTPAGTRRGPPGAYGTKPLAFTNG